MKGLVFVAHDVLIVDDDLGMREILGSICGLIDVPCRFAIHGEEALKEVKNARPGLILLDLMMPVMSGQEVLQHLKAAPETAQIPVIVFTAARLSKNQIDALSIPQSMILFKSEIGLEDIRDAIIAGLKVMV